ncbi:MAG TPA: glycosyltransferase family 39 protein, partial [Bryobacteraceae bacterium]
MTSVDQPKVLERVPIIHQKKFRAVLRSVGNPTWLLVALALSFSALFVRNCYWSLTRAAPIWVEGPVVGIMEAFRSGRVYQTEGLSGLPYTVITHTPFSYWAGYLLYRWVPDLWPLRALNIAATLGCAALIFVFVSLLTKRNVPSGVFASLSFLIAPVVFKWSQVSRSPDSFCDFFSLAALLCASSRARHRWALTTLFVVLSILSKQTAILTLVPALVVYSWREGTLKDAIRWLALGFVFLAVFVAAMQWYTRGGFWVFVVDANVMRMSGFQALVIVILLAGYWPFALVSFFLSGRKISVIHDWFLITTAVGLLTCAKVGSDTMYFFDSTAAASVLVGVALSRLTLSTGRGLAAFGAIACCYFWMAALTSSSLT